MIIKLIEYLKGCRRMRVVGAHCEQILNLLRQKGVELKRIRREDAQSLSFDMHSRDTAMLTEICARYFMDAYTINAFGMQEHYAKYKRRRGLLVGVLAILAFLAIMNCFVWDVTVVGCEQKTTEQQIKREFDEIGFGIGTYRFGLDFSQIENQFMMKNKDIIWVSVNMRFTTAVIELRERSTKKEEYFDYSTPCDIYASRDGKIISMMISSGSPLVRIGDSVSAGEMLVSRKYIGRHGEEIIVPSIAKIMAETKRKITVKAPITVEVHTPTGRNKTYFSLILFNFKIPLYFKEKISYNNYDYTEKRSKLRISRNFVLPFSLESKKYVEVNVNTEDVDLEVARQKATTELLQLEKTQLYKTEIKNKKINETKQGEWLVLEAEYVCLEDIALPVRK